MNFWALSSCACLARSFQASLAGLASAMVMNWSDLALRVHVIGPLGGQGGKGGRVMCVMRCPKGAY